MGNRFIVLRHIGEAPSSGILFSVCCYRLVRAIGILYADRVVREITHIGDRKCGGRWSKRIMDPMSMRHEQQS